MLTDNDRRIFFTFRKRERLLREKLAKLGEEYNGASQESLIDCVKAKLEIIGEARRLRDEADTEELRSRLGDMLFRQRVDRAMLRMSGKRYSPEEELCDAKIQEIEWCLYIVDIPVKNDE